MKHLVVCGSQGYRVGRGIDSPAYDFASRRRDGLAQDSFSFSENGKELCFVGLPRGAVEAVNSAAVDALPAWELPDNWSTLPNGDKSAAVYIAGPGLGFLHAGQARKGEGIVFVPGCFHHLVLRSQQSDRWKLVGLVAIGTERAKQLVSRSGWGQLRKGGELAEYTII